MENILAKIKKSMKRTMFLNTEEENVTDLIKIINHRTSQSWSKNIKIRLGDCEWDNGLEHIDMWFITFKASAEEWEQIHSDLMLAGYEDPMDAFRKDHIIRWRRA